MTTSPAAAPARTGGNETARLYAKYGEPLYRYCHARLRSREDAEDAVQSTFIRVHGALEKGVTPRFEAAWLYKIAHNVCLSRGEVTGRRAQHETPHDPATLDWAPAAPETAREELMGLSAALASMPKNLRDPILLREWQGLSYAEIAEALGTSVSAVETQIFRGRRYLAAALEPVAERPRRVLARLLDAGTAYSGLRVLLAQLRGVLFAAGPVKLAAGAAVVAIGGVGIERASVSHEPAQPAARTTTSAQLATATPSGLQHTPTASGATRATSTVGPVATTFPAAAPQAATAPDGSVPEVPAAVPPTSTRPTVTPDAAAPVPAVVVPTLTPPATPAIALSTVTAPTVTLPAVDTNALPVPALTVPALAAPAVTVPAVTPPGLPVTVPG